MRKVSVVRKLGAFVRDRSAVTAIEFSLVAFPFIITLLGIFDITNSYFASTTLENGVLRIARQVKTGEIQASNINAQQFRQLLCNEVTPLLACDARLQVDVRPFAQFNQTDFTPPLNPDGTINMAFQFTPGPSNSVVLVRGFYVWHVATPLFGALFSNMAGDDLLLTSAAAFRNEPYAAGSGPWNQ